MGNARDDSEGLPGLSCKTAFNFLSPKTCRDWNYPNPAQTYALWDPIEKTVTTNFKFKESQLSSPSQPPLGACRLRASGRCFSGGPWRFPAGRSSFDFGISGGGAAADGACGCWNLWKGWTAVLTDKILIRVALDPFGQQPKKHAGSWFYFFNKRLIYCWKLLNEPRLSNANGWRLTTRTRTEKKR